MNVDFEITGVTPLLMHADDLFLSDELSAWRKAPENKNLSVAGDDRSPAWTWQSYLYTDGEHVVIPQENLMCALRAAGAQIILKKQKTFKELTQSGMVVTSEFCEFLAAGKKIPVAKLQDMRDKTFAQQAAAVKSLGFDLFAKRAKVGQSKHVRVRPKYGDWKVRGTLNVFAAELTREIIGKLFDLAGRIGIGDWRPGCKTPGPFGMFESKLKFY